MLKNFFILKNIFITGFCLIFFFGSHNIFCQTPDNLEIFYALVDSSGENIINNLSDSDKNIDLSLTLGKSYSLFANHLMLVFYKAGYKINSKDTSGKTTSINYVLDQAEVNYGDIFRKGLFGSYFLPRRINISGNYSVKNNSFVYKEFSYNYLDTVKVDSIKVLENNSYLFTQGDVPPEPFFSSLFEPMIAIGTAAIAVFLFFTIRSK